MIPVLLTVDITGSKEPQVDDDCGAIERIIPATVMALNPGTRLGPYEVLSLKGAGGMGEVYKAKDTRLGPQPARSRAAFRHCQLACASLQEVTH